MRRLLCAVGTLALTTSVGCTAIADTNQATLPLPQTSLCTTGKLGQAIINSTGKVPDGCVKIEGGEIGRKPQILTLTDSNIRIEFSEWQLKGDSRGEFIGFKVTTSAPIAFAVKAGGSTYAGTGTSWVHPKGTTGPEANAISNVTFCPADPEGNPAPPIPFPETAPPGGENPNPNPTNPEPTSPGSEGPGNESPGEGGSEECPPFGEGPGTGTPPTGTPAGGNCEEANECLSNTCREGLCEPGAEGTPCLTNSDCSSASCVNYICEAPGAGEGTPGGETGGEGSEPPFSEGGSGGSTTPGTPTGGSDSGSGGDEGGSTTTPPVTELAGTGAQCTSASQCYSNSCQANLCEGNVAGEPCRATTDCASGLLCSENVCTAGIG